NNRAVTFDSLAVSQSATITIVATANCSFADGTIISNTATVSSSTLDSNASNNSATATTTASNPSPAIGTVSVDKPILWPPNHKMELVTVKYTLNDNCGATCSLSAISN